MESPSAIHSSAIIHYAVINYAVINYTESTTRMSIMRNQLRGYQAHSITIANIKAAPTGATIHIDGVKLCDNYAEELIP